MVARRRHAELLLAQFFEALLAEFLHDALAFHDDDFIADVGHVAEADELDGHAGPHFFDGLAAVVDERLGLAPMRAADEGLADFERALADDDGGHGALAGVHGGLDDGGAGRGARIGLEFQHFGLEGHGFEQVVDAEAGLGGDFHALDLTTPIHRREADVLKLALHPHDIGGGQVALVDGDHELDAGGLGMAERLLRLRHDAVVRSDDQHDDVGDIGTTGAHSQRRRRDQECR